MCFIINDPKKREIFAADFRDRIVHHLFFNLTHERFERTFIADTYSCIEGRGSHYGINRLEHHIRSVSLNYTRPCYVLKLDIRGYFMGIHRPTLYDIAIKTLGEDNDFLSYLTKEIAMLDPTKNCKMISKQEEYIGLPDSKTLFKSKKDCGLPIGNLTSQLFSNVYLNVFDQYMKRELKCRHYGRYVDDAYVVGDNKEWLKEVREKAKTFLLDILKLELHEGKSHIVDAYKGVEFLGAFIKPHRRYISNQSLKRIRKRTSGEKLHRIQSSASRQGILSHYKSYNIRKQLTIEGIL